MKLRNLLSLIFLCVFFCSCKKTDDTLKQEVGKYLFYDRDLSINQTKSCASCHNPNLAFTDGYKKSFGAYADEHQHNTLPLFNLKKLKFYTYTDSSVTTIERQMLNPFFAVHPIEMGLDSNDTDVLKKIYAKEPYKRLLKNVPNHETWEFTIGAISEFIKTITSDSSRYDLYLGGKKEILDQEEKLGMELFFSKEAGCSNCHGGINFSTPTFKNDLGDTIYHYKHIDASKKYRVPSLRNLTYTTPYFHDGSAINLLEVMQFYQRNNHTLYERNQISGSKPTKQLSHQDVYYIIKFLKCLDDPSLLTNKAYGNPFLD